jgi:hypothetical protein
MRCVVVRISIEVFDREERRGPICASDKEGKLAALHLVLK